MGYVTTKKGIKWIRLVVPDELVSVIGKKNLMESLETKDNRVASQRAPAVIVKFQQQIAEAKREATPMEWRSAYIPWNPCSLGARIGRQLVPVGEPIETLPIIEIVPATADAVTFDEMVEKWGREKKVPDRGQRRMLSKAIRFAAWLKADRLSRGVTACADDMRLVTRNEYIRYKEDMLTPGSEYSHTTVKHHLDDLRTLFRFASKNRSFPNPTDDVTRLQRKNGRNKWRPYTLDERIKILTEARKEGPVVRWCQWVAWATGARVAEVAEASTKDICQIGGMWCIKILLDNREKTAELKNEESHRIVALHSALIAEGFLDYVESIRHQYGDRPLFPRLKPDRDGRRGTPASNRVSKWLRNRLKVTDRRIAPNHSWRHTFETAHRNEMEPPTREDIVNHITGRSQGAASGRHYGIFEIRRDRIEIEKMPCPV